jgi:hypothetical protein
MPSFAASLSDEQIAAVTNYVRTNLSNTATADASPHDVMALRQTASLPPMATMAADQFGCPHVGASSVADPGNGLMGIYNGATPETIPNRTRALIVAVRASNSTISTADLTNTLLAAYCPVVANQTGLSTAEKKTAMMNFLAGATPLINGTETAPN